MVNEAVSGIKNIKFNAWENIVKKRCGDLRVQETSHNFKYLDIRFILNGLADLVPVFLNLAFISIYTRYIAELNLTDSLILIAYGNMLMMPTKNTVVAFGTLAGARVSCQRLDKLLFTKIAKKRFLEQSEQIGRIDIEDLSAGWTVRSKLLLARTQNLESIMATKPIQRFWQSEISILIFSRGNSML